MASCSHLGLIIVMSFAIKAIGTMIMMVGTFGALENR